MSATTTLTLRELWERDGRICHVCGGTVALRFATRDHVVPRSRGGSNAVENLALAHRWCNEARGNSLDGVPAEVIARVRARREWASQRQACVCSHHRSAHPERGACQAVGCRCECYFAAGRSEATV